MGESNMIRALQVELVYGCPAYKHQANRRPRGFRVRIQHLHLKLNIRQIRTPPLQSMAPGIAKKYLNLAWTVPL